MMYFTATTSNDTLAARLRTKPQAEAYAARIMKEKGIKLYVSTTAVEFKGKHNEFTLY